MEAGRDEFKDIPCSRSFTKIEILNKGWSRDRKFYIETENDERLLLRIANICEHRRKLTEFNMMQRVAALGVPMSQPVTFGICNGGKSVYSLITWCDGKDAKAILPSLSEPQQFELGAKAGRILKAIHSLPAPDGQEEWASRFNRKINEKIERYKGCGLRFEGDWKVLAYIEANRHLVEQRPQCRQHGDYHVGNMIISEDMGISIIDFDRPDFGDPWEEFNRIVWSATVSPHFATGQLNGYFDGRPPVEFFRLLTLYIAVNTLSSIYWAIPFGQGEVDTMMKQSQDVLRWFSDMSNPLPTWYLEDLTVYLQNK
jgi:serine/threonine-protein kinase